MRHKTTFWIGILLAAMFIAYMVTYQVQFNQAAVVTTFGNAGANSVRHGDRPEEGIIGNLHLKWPWPIQDIRFYDKRVQVLEDRLEEQQTLDKQSVVANTYVSWRITDPLNFYRSLVTLEQAEQRIESLLRDARSVIGNYTFDELTNTDPDKLKLAQVEADILEKLNSQLKERREGGDAQPLGISFSSVGIKRLVLPDTVTEKVFSRMRSTRQRLAQSARSQGDADAKDIRATANSDRETILAFAKRRADEIRSRGDAAAAEYYKVFAENERFAGFLRKLKAYREVLKHNSTFILDTQQGLFSEFSESTPSLAPPEQAASEPGGQAAAEDGSRSEQQRTASPQPAGEEPQAAAENAGDEPASASAEKTPEPPVSIREPAGSAGNSE
jgi:membrane protease subunit HflC